MVTRTELLNVSYLINGYVCRPTLGEKRTFTIRIYDPHTFLRYDTVHDIMPPANELNFVSISVIHCT